MAKRLSRSTRFVTRQVERGLLEPAAKAPGQRGAFLFDEIEVDAYVKSLGES